MDSQIKTQAKRIKEKQEKIKKQIDIKADKLKKIKQKTPSENKNKIKRTTKKTSKK
jgi:hypothetical protein